MIIWPDYLPTPELDGYGIQHVDTMQRTQLESGRARQRRRFTSVPSNASVSWVMTNGQAAYFESWYKNIIKDGADWFEGPLKTPVGFGNYKIRFTAMYQGPVPFAFNQWRTTANVEIFERPTIPVEALESPEYLEDAEIFDIAMNVYWPAA